MSDRKKYVMRFIWGVIGYVILLLAADALMEQVSGTFWVYPMALVPLIPAVVAVLAYVEILSMLDELQRKIQSEAFSFAFVATAFLTITWGLLHDAGIGEANLLVVPSFMVLFWWAGYQVAKRRYK